MTRTVNLSNLVRSFVEQVIANPDVDDAVLERRLLEQGADVRMARRAIVLVPMAFCRALLEQRGPAFPTTFQTVDDEGGLVSEHVLADGPIFVEGLLAAAATSDGQQVATIAARSADFNAINLALHGGSKLEDLQLTPSVGFAGYLEPDPAASNSSRRWWKFWDSSQATEPAPPQELHWETDAFGPMAELSPESRELAASLRATLAEHGAMVDEKDLRAEARVFCSHPQQGRSNLQLDFVLAGAALGDRSLCESLAGLGPDTAAALRNGLEKFQANVLHPIVAGLVDDALFPEQVEWNQLGTASERWRTCSGGILQHGAVPNDLGVPEFVDALMKAWMSSGPSREVHWPRWYVMMLGSERTGAEVLVDNEPWGPGQALLENWKLPEASGLYSLRSFTIVVPG